MSFTTKPLTPECLEDYLWFFDNRAFCNHPEWATCYCTFYTLKGPLEKWENRTGQQNRVAAEQQIKDGYLKGFLAYDGDVPVGFCNVNAKESYFFDKYRTEINNIGTAGTVSIVCFVIDPDFRRKGISRLLLEAAIDYYKKSDYNIIESYPSSNTLKEADNYHGFTKLYKEKGFKAVDFYEKFDIMQLKIE